MDNVKNTTSFADTPKDGQWYRIPCLCEDLAEYIRWEAEYCRWMWIMVKDNVVAVDQSFVFESK